MAAMNERQACAHHRDLRGLCSDSVHSLAADRYCVHIHTSEVCERLLQNMPVLFSFVLYTSYHLTHSDQNRKDL